MKNDVLYDRFVEHIFDFWIPIIAVSFLLKVFHVLTFDQDMKSGSPWFYFTFNFLIWEIPASGFWGHRTDSLNNFCLFKTINEFLYPFGT